MSQPVITLTLNPALDQTVTVPLLRTGAVNLASEVHVNAGGKGVNVASCLADWGVPVMASGLLGRDNAGAFVSLFEDKGIADRFLRLPGSTRTNIKLVAEDTLDTTDVNLPGVDVPDNALPQLVEQLQHLVEDGQIVVVAGSLPPALQQAGYLPLLHELKALGAEVVLDTSGEALAQVLAQDEVLPAMIKPNRHELEEWVGRTLPSVADVAAKARALNQRGIATVVVSLGGDGALLSTRQDGCWLASPLAITPVSTVGAGDALVAGMVAARHADQSWPQALRLGTAFAAAKLQRLGPHLPPRADVKALLEQVQLQAV